MNNKSEVYHTATIDELVGAGFCRRISLSIVLQRVPGLGIGNVIKNIVTYD
jgi:hypothetical protein